MAGGGMSQILNNLFVGSEADAKDQAQMNQNEVSHMVRIGDNPTEESDPKLNPPRTFLRIALTDTPEDDLRPYISQVNRFVHDARLAKKSVLICSPAGASRSVALAAAYLMSVTPFGHTEAIRALKFLRERASPNEGFEEQLSKFQKEAVKNERRSLWSMFNLESEDPLGDAAYLRRRLDQIGEKVGGGI